MASKLLAYDARARKALQRGADRVADAVKVTLGPRGRNVVIEKSWGSPTVTKDGVTVAKDIELADPIANMGAQLVKEVSKKTSKDAGDGTTTATVLAQAILGEGLKNVAAGASPLAVKRGLEQAVAFVIERLQEQASPVADQAAYENVASIAGNGREVGRVVAEALGQVGRDGVVTIEQGKTAETEIDLVEGMQFDKGYLSPYMVTNPDAMECELEEPYLLFWEKKLSDAEALLPLLQKLHEAQAQVLFVAEDVEGQALATLVVNNLRGILRSAAVKAPGFGDRRKAMLQDLAILTGGTFFTEDLGLQLESVSLDQLGRADKVVVTGDTTTIVGGRGAAAAIAGRVASIRREIEETTSDYDREKLEERLAKLAGGVAKILVGASTETELKEKKARFENALNSTRAAIDEGIVVGGGTALARVADSLKACKAASADEQVGVEIIRRALVHPLKQIAENAGLEGSVVLQAVTAKKDPHYGFNAGTLQYGDLFAAGVVDPLKVVRSALENGSSIAGMILTTECTIADKPEPKKAAPPPPGGGGMGDMGGMGGMGGMPGMGGMGF